MGAKRFKIGRSSYRGGAAGRLSVATDRPETAKNTRFKVGIWICSEGV